MIKDRLIKAKKIFDDVEISIFGFRPPGWGIDKNEYLFEVIKDIGFLEYIAASSLNAGLNYNNQKVDNFMPSLYKGILNIPQNLELDLSIEGLMRNVEWLVNNNKLISLKGHFSNMNYITNNFTRINYEKLKTLVSYLKNYKIWYATFKEVSDYFKCINSAIIKTNEVSSNYKKTISINLPYKINGLTVLLNVEIKTEEFDTVYDFTAITDL